MIHDDVISRLVDLHDHIRVPATAPAQDAARGLRMLRRRRAMVLGAAAAAVVTVLGAVAVAGGGPRAGEDLDPVRPGHTQAPTPAPTVPPDDQVSLDQIRAEGQVEREQVTRSGI